ncbi:MAG TPA: hypothetical protein VNU21_08370 [Usitatibacter sp.]|nr:hypothetical protein [Usitatibacter sp.]
MQAWPRPWAAAALLLAACGPGTVIVDYAVSAEVVLRNVDDGAVEVGEVVVVPRPAGLLSPFDAVQYRGRDFEWTLGTGTLGMGGSVANRSPSRLCMRFDEARISSNLHPAAVPLKAYSWATFEDKWKLLGSTDPKQRRDFRPPALCVEPGKETRVSFAPDLGDLFPTQKMFNVRWDGNETELTDKGIGNWIALSLPVSVGDKAQVMDVRLTAVDSKARISTY